MERTLEQVIMDASQELFGDGFGSGAVRRSEAVEYAEAVRAWMIEHNKISRDMIRRSIWNHIPEGAEDINVSAIIDDILASILSSNYIKEIEVEVSQTQESLSTFERLTLDSSRKTEIDKEYDKLRNEEHNLKIPPWNDLVAEAACVTTMWEEKVNEYPECKELLDLVGKLSTRLNQSQAEVARASQKSKVWGIADKHVQEWRDKAAKYDELRKKFPFFPEEYVYILRSNGIQQYRIERICSDGVLINSNNHQFELIAFEYTFSTVEDCKNSIPVIPVS
jgi:hypothetical protein